MARACPLLQPGCDQLGPAPPGPSPDRRQRAWRGDTAVDRRLRLACPALALLISVNVTTGPSRA
eukprot:6315315-Alexandrium_andersonii.AAC.1